MDRIAGAILIASGSISLTLLSTAERGEYPFLMLLGIAQLIAGLSLMVDLGAWLTTVTKPPEVVNREDEEH